MLTKNDFPQYDGLYYVGNVIDIDGDGWVDEEQVELIIEEINAGVGKVQIIKSLLLKFLGQNLYISFMEP